MNTIPQHPHEKKLRLVTTSAVIVSAFLILVKLVAWSETHSIGILASLLDSAFDVTSALMIAFAVRYSLQPPDHDHRYGHGKAESLAAFIQAALIFTSAVILLFESIKRILTGVELVEQEKLGMMVMAFSSLVSFVLYQYQIRIHRETKSIAVLANAENYQMDFMVNLSVLGALGIVALTDFKFVDALVGAAISLYLMYGGFKTGRASVDVLMDRELSAFDRDKIVEIALMNPQVHRVTEVRTRSAGNCLFIDLTLNMSGILTLSQAQDIQDIVAFKIKEQFPTAEVHIHKVPYLEKDPLPKMPPIRPIRNKETLS